jgi:membrane protein
MKKTLKQTFDYARFVGRRFVEDRCLMVAGSLTYTTLLALVPVFAVTLTLTARVPMVRDFILQVKSFILKNFLPDVAGRMVGVYMEQFAQNAARLTVIGLIIILATAIALLFTIDGAFNAIWRTKQRRSWWKRLVAYASLLILGPLLIGASLSMTSYLVHWSSQFGRVLPMLDDWLLKIIPFVLTALALVLAYRTVPSRYVPTRHAVIGGMFAAILFEIVKHLFVAYVVRVPTYSLVYGAFASVPIFLLWLFCCWMVVLIGAEVTATLSYFRHPPAKRATRDLVPSMRVREAKLIVDALAASPVPLAFNALRLQAPMPIDVAEDILHDLSAAKIITGHATRRYQLAGSRADIREEDIRAAIGAD